MARQPVLTRLAGAARLAMPGWIEAVCGSLIWALLMGAAAWLSFILSGWQNVEQVTFVAAFFVTGGFLAFAPAIWIGRFLSRGRTDVGFAASLLALAILTVGITALLTALQYRQYYSTWHDHPFTIRWCFEFVFTTAAAIYQFLVLGLRAYFPCGFVALIAASWWNATRLR
jgi:hypothetical protein